MRRQQLEINYYNRNSMVLFLSKLFGVILLYNFAATHKVAHQSATSSPEDGVAPTQPNKFTKTSRSSDTRLFEKYGVGNIDPTFSKAYTLQMKKIGLEIPESTRKDMEHDESRTNNVLNDNPRKRRRILQCEPTQYNSSLTELCVECTTFDAQCTSCLEAGCTTCGNGYSLDPVLLTCYCNTTAGYSIAGGQCILCPANCVTCSAPTVCTTCMAGNYYNDAGQCNYCGSTCLTCGSSTSCGTCSSYYGLVGPANALQCGVCPVGTCATGSSACLPAATGCASCSIITTNCTSCQAGYSFVASMHTCQKLCLIGEYLDSWGNCVSCTTAGCSKCFYMNSQIHCSECLSTHVLLPTYSCQLYAAPDDTKYRLPSGLLSLSMGSYPVRYTRNFGTPQGHGRYTINPTTLAYMPCAAPMSTCVRMSETAVPTSCALNTALFNNSCVAKFASGFVNSTSMQVVASPDPKVLFYDSTGALTCALGYFWRPPGVCEKLQCLSGYYFGTTGCVAVGSLQSCLRVDDNNQCAECERNFFLSGGGCARCHQSCQLCTSPADTDCILCTAGFQKRQDGLCTPACNTGTTLNTTIWACWEGKRNCATYDRDQACTSCPVNFYLTPNYTCEPACPYTQYLNESTNSCNPCPMYCLECTNNTCTVCDRGYEVQAGLCAVPDCVPGCAYCSGNGTNQCLKALPQYYLNYSNEVVKYTPYCDYGKYYNSTYAFCDTCHNSCRSCRGSTPSDCIECANSNIRYGSVCLNLSNTTCQIFNGETISRYNDSECVPCTDTKCKYCPNQTCQECKPGYFPSNGTCGLCNENSTYCMQATGQSSSCRGGYTMVGHECMKRCRSGYARLTATSENCTRCPEECMSCSDVTLACTSCPPGEVMYFPSASTWNCTNNQDVSFNGYYLSANGSKVRCEHPALTCTQWSIMSCVEGYYFSGSSCVECADRCLTCSGAASNCTSCHMGYTYDGALGTCTAVCERYEYLDTASLECIPCSRNCRTCDPNGGGLLCWGCFEGFFFDYTQLTCTPCTTGCAVCTNYTCSSCLPEYMLSSGICIKSCATGLYYDWVAGDCRMCHKFCTTCVGPSMYNCTGCMASYTNIAHNLTTDRNITTWQCLKTCATTPTPYINVLDFPNECEQKCHPTCLTCSGFSPNACLTCVAGKYLAGARCEICHPNCITCNGPGINQCLSCGSGFTVNAGYCSKTCRVTVGNRTTTINYNPINMQCVNTCNARCGGWCMDAGATSCLNCNGAYGLQMFTGACDNVCAEGQYDTTQKICLVCHDDCATCYTTLRTDCLSCKTAGYVVSAVDRFCRKSCEPQSFKMNTTHCGKCDISCFSCNTTQPTGCTNCYDGFFVNPNGTCQSTCPDGYMESITPVRKCLKCGGSCKRCSEPKNPYACILCPIERYLRPDRFCAINCVYGFYFDDISNACLKCHPDCGSCETGSSMECKTCAIDRMRYYTNACVKTCPSDSAKVGSICKKCHISCLTCTNDGPTDCTSCQGSLYLTLAGQCSTQCDPHQIANKSRVCEKCHPSCDSCWNTSITGCITCTNPSYSLLTATGSCVDCLKNPDQDTEVCWFSVPLTLIEPPARALLVSVSTTVKLSFAQQTLFMNRLSMTALTQVIKIDIPLLTSTEWTYELRYESGDILIDLKFTQSKLFNVQLQVSPKIQIVLKNNKTGVAELIFWNRTASYDVPVRKAPNSGVMDSLASVNQGAISSGAGAAQAIMTTVAILSSSGAGGILLKFLQVFKLLGRLRLLNVYFGSYLEVCLRLVAQLYPLGGDDISNAVVCVSPRSRGKLDTYKVSVMSADAVPWKYCAYFAMLAVRFYRNKVRFYANQIHQLSTIDYLVDSIGERCRTLIIAMVGIDIAFYSLRCLSHLDLTLATGFDAPMSYLLSFFTLTVMTADLIMLFYENAKTDFRGLRSTERLKRHVLEKDNMAKNKKGIVSESAQRLPEDLQDTQGGSPENIRGTKVFDMKNLAKKKELGTKLYRYLYGYRQQKRVIDNPSAEQFFGNGIKLHKLRTPEGRYYNSMAMLKLLSLEPIFINFQLFSVTQMVLILMIQIVYVAWLVRAGIIVGVFESKLSLFSALANELAVLIFLLTGTIFAMAGGVDALSDKYSGTLQMMAIGCIVAAAVVGFCEFTGKVIGIVISTIKNRRMVKLLKERELLKKEQGLVRHRVIGRDLPGAEPPVPPVDADMSSSVADIKANQVGQSAKPVLGKTRLAPGKRLSRPPLQPLARK